MRNTKINWALRKMFHEDTGEIQNKIQNAKYKNNLRKNTKCEIQKKLGPEKNVPRGHGCLVIMNNTENFEPRVFVFLHMYLCFGYLCICMSYTQEHYF